MNSRSVSLLVALITIVGVGLVLVQKGYTAPYAYVSPSAPIQPVPSQPDAKPTKVTITQPKASTTVPALFTVSGQAPGYWASEAQFPIVVRDMNLTVVASTTAHMEGDWMTAQPVPFSASVDATASGYHGPAVLILMKDNPSGLPENEDSVSMPIIIQ